MESAMLSQVTTSQRDMMTCFPKTASREGAQQLSFFTFTEEVKFGNTKKISLNSESIDTRACQQGRISENGAFIRAQLPVTKAFEFII